MQGKGGGIEIAEEFVLSKSLLTEDEKNMIMTSLHSFDGTGNIFGDGLLTKLSALFKVKNTNWIEVDFNNWQNNKIKEETFNLLKSAILNKKIISFSYFATNKDETNRSAKAVRLLFKGQDWYLYAFCLLRNDFRYFKLSRIKNLVILPSSFDDDFEDVILKKEIKYEKLIRVKVKFDKKVAFRVYDELSPEIREDDEGNLYAQIEMPSDYNLYSYIFSYGDMAEVLEPVEIREKIRDMIEKMKNIYKI